MRKLMLQVFAVTGLLALAAAPPAAADGISALRDATIDFVIEKATVGWAGHQGCNRDRRASGHVITRLSGSIKGKMRYSEKGTRPDGAAKLRVGFEPDMQAAQRAHLDYDSIDPWVHITRVLEADKVAFALDLETADKGESMLVTSGVTAEGKGTVKNRVRPLCPGNQTFPVDGPYNRFFDPLTEVGKMSRDGLIVLPATGLRKDFLAGKLFSFPVMGELKEKYGSVESDAESTVTTRVTFTVRVGTGLDVVLEPVDGVVDGKQVDYKGWLPEGGKDDQTPGNSISLLATVKTADGSALKPDDMPVSFEFILMTSAEPGVSLNQPPDGAPKDTLHADLQIDGKQRVTLPATGDHAKAKITSYDWGAHGDVQVIATLRNGSRVPGRLKGTTDGYTVLVPDRPLNSEIGSAWDRKGRADVDDDETSPDNHNDGDGLTTYAEYRGLMTKAGHVRLDPGKKELMVVNETGMNLDPGLKRFEQASGIHVVVLAPDQMRPDRVINPNDVDGSNDQHGLRIVGKPLGDRVMGRDPEAKGGGVPPSPAACDEVILNNQLTPTIAARLNIQTVPHELAHCLGVPHHGDDRPADAYRPLFGEAKVGILDPTTGQTEARDNDDALWKKLDQRIGDYQGTASGDVGCLMRYPDAWDYMFNGDDMTHLTKMPRQQPGDHFCTDGKGALANPWGTAAQDRGDCKGKLRVRD